MTKNIILFIFTYFAFMFILFIWSYFDKKANEGKTELKWIRKGKNTDKSKESYQKPYSVKRPDSEK